MDDPDIPDVFDSEEDARAWVASHLAARVRALAGENDAAWRAVSRELLDPVEVERAPRSGPLTAPALVRRFRWVIRTDDLKLFRTVLEALVKLPALVAGPAGILPVAVDAFLLVKRARDKGAVLDPRSFAVVAALRVDGPMTAESLVPLLRATDDTWTRDELAVALKRLSAYPAHDGSTLALVAHDGERWRVTGL
jgi:hypothetical protein